MWHLQNFIQYSKHNCSQFERYRHMPLHHGIKEDGLYSSMKQVANRAKSPGKKKLRGGQLVVPVNPLETHIYVNFTISGTTITSATTTDGRVVVGSTGPGTMSLTINASLTTFKNYTLYAYNGTKWAEIPRANLDTGGTTVGLYGTDKDKLIRKQQGLSGKISNNEILIPAGVDTIGGVLNFTNLSQSMFGFAISGTPNAYIQLIFTSNYPTPNTKWMGWSPSSVPGLSLWLDAIEPGPNGFTPNIGIPVTSWQDKSGNNNHGSTSSAPIYQSNPGTTGTYKMGMYFNGTTSFFSGPMQNNTKYCCMFAVVAPDDGQGGSRVLSLGAPGVNDSTGTNTYASMSITASGNATQYTTGNSATAATSYYINSTGNLPSIGTSWINNTSANLLVNGIITTTFTGSITTAANMFTSTLTVTAVSAGFITIGMILSGTNIPLNTMVVAFVTGGGDVGTYTVTINNQVNASATTISSTTITGVSTIPISTPTNPTLNMKSYSIGKNNSGGSFFKGYVHEILVYIQPLSKQARQTIEGYLAWKWGIALNAAHLYGSTRQPNMKTIYAPFPLALDNITPIVWLDGQDPLGNESSTLPTNFTKITAWADKSGNNNHGVANSAFAPNYLGNGIVFNGTAINSMNGSRVPKYPISTYVTSTGGPFNQDNISGVAFDSSGRLYYTVYSTGEFSTFDPNISPSPNLIQFDPNGVQSILHPTGVAVDSKGNVFVLSRDFHSLYIYDKYYFRRVVGTGTSGLIPEPWVANFTGSINNNILTVTAVTSGTIAIGAKLKTGGSIVSFGSGTGGTGTYNLTGASNLSSQALISYRRGGKVTGDTAKFYLPYAITIDKNDIVYIGDCNHMIWRLELTAGTDQNNSANWNVSGFVGGWDNVQNTYRAAFGNTDGSCDTALLNFPYGLAVDPTNRYLYVAEAGNSCIRKIDIANRVVSTCQNTAGNFTSSPNGPYGLACDQYGILYVSCYARHLYIYNTEQNQGPSILLTNANATGLAVYNNTLYFSVEGGSNLIKSIPIQRPTYLYSPVSTPLTNVIHGFIVSNASGYNRNVSSMLSLGSYTGVDTYTVNTQPSLSVSAEDSTSSSYIGLYNDNGNRDLFRNNIRIQTGVSDAPGNSVTMPPSLIYFSSNNTTLSMRKNGDAFTTATGTFSTFKIGAYGLGLQPANIRRIATFITTNSGALMNYSFDGVIYEVIVYRDNLTPTQYQFLEAYLCWKWSIPLQDTTNPYFTSTTTPPNPPIEYTSNLPNPIDKITLNTINPTDFTIGWTGGDGATSYTYSITPSVSGQPSTNNGLTSKTAIFTSVNTTTTSYTITVTPRNNAGSATTATATLLQTPAAATINTYTSTGFTVNITAVTGASSYVFYLNGVKYIPTSSTATAFVFTALNGGTSYSVTYTAVSNTGHESKESPSVSGITKPSTPYSFILTRITSTSFTLTWSGGEGATSYSYSGISGQPSAGNDNGVLSKSANFTGLSNMNTYTINVTATGVNGSSAPGSAIILPAPDPGSMIFSAPSSTGFSIGSITPVATATAYSIYLNNIKYSVTTSTSNIQITNQKPGSSIAVYARSIIGDVEGWNSISVYTIQLLATPPINFVVSNTTNTSFKLSWSGGDGATSYRYSLQPSTDNGVASKSAIFTGLFSSNTYTISVEAMNGTASSGAGTVTVLAAPGSLSATNATPTTVSITIFGNIFNVPGVTGAESYNLYMNGTLYVNSASTTIPITVLNRGANLTFIASAVSNGVEGFKSDPFVVQLPPTTPTNLTLSDFTNTGFKVNWTGPSSPEATGYSYRISSVIGQSGTTPNSLVDNGLTSQSVTFSNLNSRTATYTVYVTALAGSTPSQTASITVPAGIDIVSSSVPPDSITQTGLTVNITSPAQTVALATSYNLYINGALYTSSTTTITTTTIVVTGQTPGSSLILSVRAIVNGVEIWAGFTTEVRLAPSTPRNLVVSAFTTTSFNLGWTGPVSPEASTYVYTISNTVGQAGVTPDPANITDMGIGSNMATFWNLDSTKTYTITVQAKRGSYVSGIATVIIPAAATNLSANAITVTGFTLRIGSPVSGASSYNVYINGIATSFPATSQSSTTSISSETFIITGQTGGSIVSVYIRAIVGGQEFWPSATLTVPLLPTPITNITPSEYNMNGFKLTWSGGDGATSYSYGITCSNAGWKTVSPSGSNDSGVASKYAIFTQLSYQNSYTITVSAVNVSGSSSAPITILNGPTNVSSSNVTATDFTLTINAAVTGATSYNIYINSGQTFTVGSYTLLQNTTTVGTGITVTGLPAESLTKLVITSKFGDIEGWPYNYFSTQFSSTNGLTSTNGNIFNIISDSTNNLYISSQGTSSFSTGAIISKISIYGGNMSTFKSIDGSQSPFNSTSPVFPQLFDPDGNLYGLFNNRIFMFDITGNFSYITAVYTGAANLNYSVSGTQASSTQFKFLPDGTTMVIDSQRNLYVFCVDQTSSNSGQPRNSIICKISYSGKNSLGVPQFGLVTLFAGTGLYQAFPAGSASLDTKTAFYNTFYNGDGGSALTANLIYISNMSIDSNNNIYISTWPYVIRKITPGGIITTVVGASSYLSIAGLVPFGYTVSTAQAMDGSNKSLVSNIKAQLTIDSNGNMFLRESASGILYRVSSTGIVTFIYGFNSGGYLDNFGNLYSAASVTPGSAINKLTPYFPIQLTVTPITLSPLQLSAISTSTTSISSSTGITITWTATGGVTSYSYYGAGIPSTDNGLSSQTATFTGLTNTNTYTVTVTASKWGASVFQTVTILPAPTLLTALERGATFYSNITSTSSLVSIFTVTNAQSYNIYLGVPPILYTTVTNSGDVTIANQPAGSLLTVSASAVIGGQSGFQSVKQLQLKPSNITGISITYNSISEVTINWSGGDGATSYIYYNLDSNFSKITGPTPTISGKTAVFTGLTSTTNYYGSILPVNSTVIVSRENMANPGVDLMSPLIEIVNAPTLTNSSIGSITTTGFTLTVSSYSKSSYFNLYINGILSKTNIKSDNLTPYTLTGRAAGELLNLYLRAIVGGIEIWPSNTIAFQLSPSQPINLATTFTTSTTGFSLTWTGGDGATSYSFSGLPLTPTITNKTAVITGVVSTTSYIIRVTAMNSGGSTASSNFTVPAAPTLTNSSILTKTPTGFTLRTSTVTGATSYNVYINNSLYSPASSTINTTITGQAPGALLNIYVRAVVGGQEIWPSNTFAVQLPPPIYTLPGTGADAKPLQFAFDTTGNLYYISESLNLYKLANTGTICEPTYASTATLLAGASGISIAFNNPTAMVFDTAGNLYVADNNAQNVLKFTNSGSAAAPTFSGVSTFISTANKANIKPWALAFDAGDNLYISDMNNQQILKVSKTAGNLDPATLTTVVGSVGAVSTSVANGDGGPALSATLYNVKSLAFDGNGNLYFTSDLHKVNIVYNTGTATAPVFGNIDTISRKLYYGSGIPVEGGMLSSTGFSKPNKAVFDKSGNLYIADDTAIIIANNTGTASTPSYGIVNILYNSSTPISTPLRQLSFNSGMAMWFIDSSVNNILYTPVASLSAPRNITVSSFTSTGFTLKWLGADKASSYAYSPAAATDNGITSKSAIFTGLTAGTPTTVTITPNCGANSTPASITIPGAPSGLTSSDITSTGFTLTIGTPVAGATSYNVYINGSLYLIPASTTTSSPTTIVIGGQTASATLSVTVSGIVGGVQGWPSSPLSVQLS